MTKPFRDQDLLDAIQLGLARDRAWLENEKAIAALRGQVMRKMRAAFLPDLTRMADS